MGVKYISIVSNPKSWLPPCCPIGHWWQGQLYMATPKSQERADSDQDGHPARVKAKGQQKSRRKVRAALHLR
jgi:hypothetical protein